MEPNALHAFRGGKSEGHGQLFDCKFFWEIVGVNKMDLLKG